VSADRLARVRAQPALAGGAFARWREGRVAVVGAGVLGARFALEAVRRGARVLAIDPDRVETANLGTLPLPAAAVGQPKAAAVVAACEAIEPARARALLADVRAVGGAVLGAADLLVDASDDPALTQPLTELANGLALPLLRLAVDGSGARDMGRVQVSFGGGGHACALCPLTLHDLGAAPRTPCPGGARAAAPTLAGAAALAVVAAGLLQAQRLLGGNGRERTFDREWIVDLEGAAIHELELERRPDCPSGHVRYDLLPMPSGADETTPRDLFARARGLLGDRVALVPGNGPFGLARACGCGEPSLALSTPWSPPPPCPACGEARPWQPASALPGLNLPQAESLRVLDQPLSGLGLPDGAIVAAVAGDHAVHFALAPRFVPFPVPPR